MAVTTTATARKVPSWIAVAISPAITDVYTKSKRPYSVAHRARSSSNWRLSTVAARALSQTTAFLA